MKTIEVNGQGVFLVEREKLDADQIKRRINRTRSRVYRIQRQITNKTELIREWEREMRNLDDQLKILTGASVQNYLKLVEAQRTEAEEKASAYLKEFIGDEVYAQLMEKKALVFEGAGKRIYKLTMKGEVYVKGRRRWNRLCIIRAKEIPLSDQILSVLVSLKEHTHAQLCRR